MAIARWPVGAVPARVQFQLQGCAVAASTPDRAAAATPLAATVEGGRCSVGVRSDVSRVCMCSSCADVRCCIPPWPVHGAWGVRARPASRVGVSRPRPRARQRKALSRWQAHTYVEPSRAVQLFTVKRSSPTMFMLSYVMLCLVKLGIAGCPRSRGPPHDPTKVRARRVRV